MKLFQWVEHRTGVFKLTRKLLYERIPGGAKWRYVWGSMLLFAFGLQVITGILLMTVYSPSATTAWSSVWYIQTEMTAGWFIRGLHHFGAQAMVVLLPLHIAQVVIAQAYRAPREFNWWIGLILMHLVLGLALTGYLLPWDQKGYWATKVATNIMGLTPLVGQALQKVVVGGSEYGHATLTRFYALHVVVLPAAVVLLVAAHVALFRRHGVTFSPKDAGKTEGNFWPDQALKDSIACAGLFVLLAGVTYYMVMMRGEHLLDAPANPATSDYPARPEWFFLFLFELLKHFEGPVPEIIGAIIVPSLVTAVLFALPLLDRVLPHRLAHACTVGTMLVILGGIGWLTYGAWRDDRNPTDEAVLVVREKERSGAELTHEENRLLAARRFNEQRAAANRAVERAFELAAERGIPPEGPLVLLLNDPMTRGPELFAANCAACHRYHGHDGLGRVPAEAADSSDLGGFGNQAWIRGLLEDPAGEKYFGAMKKPDGEPAHTKMTEWVEEQLDEFSNEADRAALLADFDAVAAYLADEGIHPGRLTNSANAVNAAGSSDAGGAGEANAEELVRQGRQVFVEVCNECHHYQGQNTGTTRAPEMFGYGSVEWIMDMIRHPDDPSRYGSTGREPAQMPPFEGKLTEQEIRLIAEWLHATRDE